MKLCFIHFTLTKSELNKCVPLLPEFKKPGQCDFCDNEAKVEVPT